MGVLSLGVGARCCGLGLLPPISGAGARVLPSARMRRRPTKLLLLLLLLLLLTEQRLSLRQLQAWAPTALHAAVGMVHPERRGKRGTSMVKEGVDVVLRAGRGEVDRRKAAAWPLPD